MAGSIKGITIELDGDTTKLGKALADVDKQSRNLQNELKQVERALKFSPGNTELLAQQQQLLAEQVQATTTRLNRLKAAQQQVQAQFESGAIGEAQFRAFQREIIQTESKLKGLQTQISKLDDNPAPTNLKTDLDKVEKEAKDTTSAIQNLAEGLEDLEMFSGLAGATLSKTFETALDSASLNTKIDVAFDVPESSMKSVKDAIKTIEAYGVDGQTALEGVRRQWALNRDASDATNAAIAKGAAVIAQTYAGLDFSEVVQEINEISGELNISQENALGLTNALLKAGFPPGNLDQIAEYGQQLMRAGYSAEEIQAIFAAGIDTKTWNIDNLMDGLKEGRIRLAEFGQEVPKAMQDLLKGTDISAKQLQGWGQSVAKGGKEGSAAMQEVAAALGNVDNKAKQNALGVSIFGTMWEDQGSNILSTLGNMDTALASTGENQQKLTEQVNELNADPMVELSKAMSDLKTALTPVLGAIADLVSAFSEWVSQNPVVAATITAIVAVIGLLLGVLGTLAPIFISLAAVASFFTVSLGFVAGVVGIVIGAIALLIAAGVALYTNWDTVSAFLSGVWEGIKSAAITAFTTLVSFLSGVWESIKIVAMAAWTILRSFLVGVWNGIKAAALFAFNSLVNFFTGVWNGIKSTVLSVWNGIKSFLVAAWNGIKSTATSVFNGIKNFLSNTWNAIKSAASNAWNAIKSAASNAWNSIKSTISNGISSAYNTVTSYVGKFKTAGSSLLSALADGIRNGISKAVSAVSSGMEKIRSYLPFSPAKVGPLSDLDKSGESFFPTFASKMNTGLKPMLAKVNAGLQEARQTIDANQIAVTGTSAASPVESSVSINFNFNGPVNLQDEQQIRDLADAMERELARRNIIINRAGGVRVYGT
jgi:phage-related minor tail protein